MDLVDEPFVADVALEGDADPAEEPTSTAGKAEAGTGAPASEPKSAKDEEPTSASDTATGEDDDPPEWKELRSSKFANLQTDKEVKAALAKSYRELANAGGASRRDAAAQQALIEKIDRLEKRLDRGRTEERPVDEDSPELQVIDEEMRSLQSEGRRADARIKKIESGWEARSRNIGRLEAKLETADDLEKSNVRAELREAQQEHDRLTKEYDELQQDIQTAEKKWKAKAVERQRALRGLEDERERQRQAEVDKDERDAQTRERFDGYVVGDLAKRHKVPEEEHTEFFSLVNARVTLDLKNRPVGPALDLRRLADHYGDRLMSFVDRMVQRRMREATRPTAPPGASVQTPRSSPRPKPASTPPRSRQEMEREVEEKNLRARRGLEARLARLQTG